MPSRFKNSNSLITLLFCLVSCMAYGQPKSTVTDDSPRIINIVNFIRQTDYRVKNADSLLFEAVEEQIKLVNQYGFPATFLFQYDALINPAYQALMKTQLHERCEIGAWWEITQPHVEAAGIQWRGEHSWVSHANIAFTTGYTPEEREKLADVYMAKFKEIYGYYPKSVGSWFIDSHTLAYLYEKYGIVASSNCKDQIGTDGYTLWGGYWNQAYYPSRLNAYMPAQHSESQIPVPIFRMLGSDPIYQYDTGLGRSRQGVISLEPVYTESGMDQRWVEYFLDAIVNQPSLAFNYAQAGQENSFTWREMKKGLLMQFPLFDSLRRENKIRLETLSESGLWFKEQFPVTPATAVTALSDVRNEGRKTVWYNSRFYRANLLWENGTFRFRDIHLFDERFESSYFKTAGTGGQFFYYTLPVVDGFQWSTPDHRAGLRFVRLDYAGKVSEILLGDPEVTEIAGDQLQVRCSDELGNVFTIRFHESRIEISCAPNEKGFLWQLELRGPKPVEFPFKAIQKKRIDANFRDFSYTIRSKKGTFLAVNGEEGTAFRIIPKRQEVVIDTQP